MCIIRKPKAGPTQAPSKTDSDIAQEGEAERQRLLYSKNGLVTLFNPGVGDTAEDEQPQPRTNRVTLGGTA